MRTEDIQPVTLALLLVLLALFNVATINAHDSKRYDEAQLWRIYNITDAVRQIALPEKLEAQFGGNIWRDNAHYLDISFEKNQLAGAKAFLKKYNLTPEVLNNNIQTLFDEETRGGHVKRPKRATGMNWYDYQDVSTIYAFLQEMRNQYPNLVTLFNIGQTANRTPLWVIRISENPTANKKIWIDGGIHAREWISPATVTYIIKNLLSNWSAQPSYVKQKTWLIMPLVNPDGYAYSRIGNRLWRKNRVQNAGSTCVGVDLNRNFDIAWTASGSSTNPCSDIYRGPSPGSELETKAVVQFLTSQKANLAAYLTYHSYSQAIVYPWAYKAGTVPNASELQRVGNLAAQRIKSKTGYVYSCAVTYQTFGIAGGGSDDWVRSNLGIEYVFTVEMRDKGYYGFALPPDQILDAGTEGYTIADTVAQAIA